MKTIIIYHSECGHTKRYAEDLKIRIAADELIEVKKMSFKKLKQYDTIFYGGNIKNNEIVGLKKLMKYYDKLTNKNIFIFGVGMTAQNNDPYVRNLVITTNDLDDKHVRLYLLPGGININLFSPLKRFMFKTALKVAKNNDKNLGGNSSQQDMAFNMLLKDGIDLVNINNLDKMVIVYNKVKDNG